MTIAVGMVILPVEQYWSPFLVDKGRARMGWFVASKKLRQLIVSSSIHRRVYPFADAGLLAKV